MSEIHSELYSKIESLKKENEYLKIKADILDIANNTLRSDISEIKVRCDLYEKALKYYADFKNYDANYVDCGKDGIKLSEPSILKDKGDIAKTVLLK